MRSALAAACHAISARSMPHTSPKPGVSTNRKGPMGCSTTPVVVPGTALTAESLRPCNRLKSVDLPLFTGPTMTSRAWVSCSTS